jgi:hypothetical protein
VSAREENAGVVAKLAEFFKRPDWLLLPEVRNTVGVAEAVRYADALAVGMRAGHPWECLRFEVKRTRDDWLRERDNPAKAAPHAPYVTASYLVVPTPRKNVVHDLDELTFGWGLIETGSSGEPLRFYSEPMVREVEAVPFDFVRALLRSADAQRSKIDTGASGGAPLRTVLHVRHSDIELSCGHSFKHLGKHKDIKDKMPCTACAGAAAFEESA